MEREEMICLTCLFGNPLETEGTVECRFLNSFIVRNDDEWCGQGQWDNGKDGYAQWGGFGPIEDEQESDQEGCSDGTCGFRVGQ